jgi:hypothetical protein
MCVAAGIFVVCLCAAPGCRSKFAAALDSPRAMGRIGMALWSFAASTIHGSGMMLVPALVPLCLGNSPARDVAASGSLTLAVAAVAVHGLAMLGTQALVAVGTVSGVGRAHRWCTHRWPNGRHAPSG